ncbi:hypothetical protein H6F93_14070 [Leptolyngbya sp. FACHB-671]|uniref:hypothetical protein n=1 Tax=Leptolyngbya sp. FACHB-671 TaxID=2692812 RepID=UPI001684222F|nr:hypothetical protein [Leptolyngbya sp. FACHB-671]MBD1869493.1 hypothetical protein [Cyanobacteria bacterium FACHB-471]MBD2068637.1 hypothetical protein [Leptolyngbya sp. FACHB-671]
MKPIQETFLELDWEDADEARQARDTRAEELQSQGFVCVLENLYNAVDGRQVFMIVATEAEKIDALRTRDSNRSDSRDGSRSRALVPKRKGKSVAEPEIC